MLWTFQDVADSQVQKVLTTEPQVPLHIVVFTEAGVGNKGCFIVGDTVRIGVPGENTLDQVLLAVLTLLAAYYVFNINYPRQYAMIMALPQTYVLGEEYMGKTTQKNRFFRQKFDKVFKKT